MDGLAPSPRGQSLVILEVDGLSKRFGGTVAVSQVSFSVPRGSIFGVIGPNGAGKTTLFNLLTGFIKADEGSIKLEGIELVGKTPEDICDAGMCRTFQITRPFPNLTVLENVTIAALARAGSVSEAAAEAEKVIDFVGMGEFRRVPGRSLNVAQRKRLELARALATRPKILLLDEVMGGLNPTEVNQALALLRRLNADGMTLVVIEHIMAAITTLCERVMVLHHGEKLTEAPTAEIANDSRVVGAYLGEEFLIARS